MRFLKQLAHVAGAAVLTMPAAPAAFATDQPPRISAAQYREDIAFIRKTIADAHPDPAFSTDPVAVQAALDKVARDAPSTLSRDEAWRRLAVLNPLFADGHFFIGHADWRSDTRAWLTGGGTLFPAEVEIAADGKLFMRSQERPRIVSVNGMDADKLVSGLLARMHGETRVFLTNLLAERWWLYHWKGFGAPGRYRLVLEEAGQRRTVDLPGSRALPRVLRDEEEFARRFDLAIGPGGRAVLKVGSFGLADPAPFLAFTRTAFARIREAGVTELEIDISRNDGGDDAMWLDGLMPYLATRPYRTGSTYRARARAQGPGPAAVSDGEIATWRQPQPGNPLRFDGKLSVRIGPGTYSSAVLFANVVRDFGIGALVGSGGAARRTQSGGTRQFRLPHSGLALYLPRFILDPPSGRAPGTLLEPGEPLPAAARQD